MQPASAGIYYRGSASERFRLQEGGRPPRVLCLGELARLAEAVRRAGRVRPHGSHPFASVDLIGFDGTPLDRRPRALQIAAQTSPYRRGDVRRGQARQARIARLKTLAAHLERPAPSRERDELRGARHRTVMLDTDVPSRSSWRARPENDPGALFQHMRVPAFPQGRPPRVFVPWGTSETAEALLAMGGRLAVHAPRNERAGPSSHSDVRGVRAKRLA